jgi:hypothetical protein
MRTREIVGGEAARFQQRNREGIAQDERGRGAARRRQCERARFGGDADVQVHVGLARERGRGASGHLDQRIALALEHRKQHQQFVGLARVGQREHDVGVGDHAEVAVPGFARMHVERRRAGGSEGRGDLARDVPGFAHADADHASPAIEQQPARRGERAIDAGRHGVQAIGLDAEHATAARGEIERGGVGWLGDCGLGRHRRRCFPLD